MSIKCIDAVWRSAYSLGGTHLLVLLALADYANEDGSEIRPSMASLARKVRCSVDQARRIVHGLERDGYVEVVSHGKRPREGGTEGTPRVYRLCLERLTSGMGARRTSGMGARGVGGERLAPVQPDVLHGRSQRLAPVQAYPSLPVIEPKVPLAADAKASAGTQLIGADQSDPKTVIWNLGVQLLVRAGTKESEARSFLGRFAGKGGEEKLAQAIVAVASSQKMDPKSYIARLMQPRRREFVG